MLDIGISSAIGFITFVLAYMGVHVTLNPPHKTDKGAWRGGFIALAIVGVVLIVIQGYRSYKASEQLQGQLVRIETNTEPHPQPQHTHLVFYPGHARDPQKWAEGVKPKIDIGYANGGEYAVQTPKTYTILAIVPVEASSKAFSSYRDQILSQAPHTGGNLPAHAPFGEYLTYEGEPFSKEDADKVHSGKYWVCGFSIAYWSDDSGDYETDFAGCSEKATPDGKNWNWRDCDDSNKETTLMRKK